MSENFLNHKAVEIGGLAARATTMAGSGHPSSSLALSHIVAALMYQHMRFDPKDPWNPVADRLVLSEGHSVPIVYAAYCDLGGVYGRSKAQAKALTVKDLDTLREVDSILDGHPNPGIGFPFFDAATGSLGQGLSVAAGLGLAARADASPRRIYCIIGDGESREGQIWEAVDFLVDNKLSNVTPIFNCNNQGQSDYVSKQQSAETTAKKLEAYGCRALVIDGHDVKAILAALSDVKDGVVTAIVAKTQKGWGVKGLHDKSNHGKPLDKAGLEAAMADLAGEKAKLPALAAGDVCAPKAPAAPKPAASCCCGCGGQTALPPADFVKMLPDAKLQKKFAEKKMLATRNAYGVALLELGKVNKKVVALDADVSNSTFSCWFAKQFPDRYYECRIAEQNMVSVAVGLAAAGKIPFLSSFAKFLVRAYDQVELATIGGANIKIVGSHAGSSLGADGPSQMSLTDVAFFRSMSEAEGQNGGPVCAVFIPADAYAAYKMTEMCVNHAGMTYMRTGRPDVAAIYDAATQFEIGGAIELIQGGDVTLVSNGYTLHMCKALIPELAKQGIKAGLVDAYSFPLRSPMLTKMAGDKRRVLVTVEDNYTGGLGSAVAELAAAQGGARVSSVVCRRVPKSAKEAEQCFDYCHCGASDVLAAVRNALKKGCCGCGSRG